MGGNLTHLHPIPTQLTLTEFVLAYGSIYEHSPWVAEQVFPELTSTHNQAAALSFAMATVVDNAGQEAQLTLLRAHPELVGKLELAELTQDSQSEQTSAGLDQCTPAEFAEFQDLNERYNAKFGFPFIFAVKGFHRTEILASFRQRIDNDTTTEFTTALDQVHRIGLSRLSAMEITQ